jgi:hypothetical protein
MQRFLLLQLPAFLKAGNFTKYFHFCFTQLWGLILNYELFYQIGSVNSYFNFV